MIEADLQTLLWQEAGVSAAIGRAVFSGVRIDQAMQFCRRIWDATGRQRPTALERAFGQLALLNAARNDLIHFGAGFDENDHLVVTNERSAHTDQAKRFYRLEPSTMDAIFNDLNVACAAIQANYLNEHETGPLGFTQKEAQWFGAQPWSYKPPPSVRPVGSSR